jgi:hypothetical protein
MATDVAIGGEGALFVGEDKTFRFTIQTAGVPDDISGWALLFDVRKSDTAADPALLSKVPTIVGVYNVDPNLNTQKAVVVVTDTDMNLFKAKTYRYSVKRMDDGSETVLVRGNFAPEKATAP